MDFFFSKKGTKKKMKKKKANKIWGFFFIQKRYEPDVIRTRNLLIWSQTRYRCATGPATEMIG